MPALTHLDLSGNAGLDLGACPQSPLPCTLEHLCLADCSLGDVGPESFEGVWILPNL